MKITGPVMLEFIKKSKTTFQFSDKKIQDRDLNMILEAARWSPSFQNCQPWSFVVIDEKKLIEKVMSSCFYGNFHTSPKKIIAIVLEPISKSMPGLLKGKFAEIIDSHKYMTIAMPVLNLVYEAESLGIGSCILSPHSDNITKLLSIPQKKEVPLAIGLGYEKKESFKRERVRNALKDIVFYNRYGQKWTATKTP